VKANQGAAGIDGQSLEMFEANLSGNLYKLWNRLASGSYFPRRSSRWRLRRKMVVYGCWEFRRWPIGLLRWWSNRESKRRSILCFILTPMGYRPGKSYAGGAGGRS